MIICDGKQEARRYFPVKGLYLIPLLSLLVLNFVNDAQAVTCHCFRDRLFEPSRPASADPYILATTRNSLLAAASGIEKKAVVRQRMTGATESDLWLSAYLSTVTDYSGKKLWEARDKTASWNGALDHLNLDTAKLGKNFNIARENGDPDAMARALADPVLGKVFDAGEGKLLLMKRKGANIAESALSLYLAAIMNRNPEDILNEVRKGKQTWGSLLNSQGISIDGIGDLIAEAVRNSGI